jgi:hypothetical protein
MKHSIHKLMFSPRQLCVFCSQSLKTFDQSLTEREWYTFNACSTVAVSLRMHTDWEGLRSSFKDVEVNNFSRLSGSSMAPLHAQLDCAENNCTDQASF